MKSIITKRESGQISIALDSEALQELIKKLKDFQGNKSEARFPIETVGDKIDLVFIPFDIQNKEIQSFFKDKEELDLIKNSKK